ncbi:MAG: SDR family NAD(P)-dependent oxidoreductase [Acidimicrobiia bacterium]
MTEGGRLRGRRILITGAASGIGRATSVLFAQEGAQVALLDRQADALEQVADELGGTALVTDLADIDATSAAVEAAAAALGGLDGVVNVAGIGVNGPLSDLDPGLWAKILSINLTAPYVICRTALPYLEQVEGSSIVNVSSGVALLPKGAHSGYAASKGGLVSFSKSLAFELAPKIRVNVVCPGMVVTGMSAQVHRTEVEHQRSVAGYAMGRPGQADELANAILFLISHESSFVTGVTLAVDGGRTFH